MTTDKTIKELMLLAPESQLDNSIKPLIEKWRDPPQSLEILEVLDKVIYTGTASGFVVQLLEQYLNQTLKEEHKTLMEITQLAIWRTNLP